MDRPKGCARKQCKGYLQWGESLCNMCHVPHYRPGETEAEFKKRAVEYEIQTRETRRLEQMEQAKQQGKMLQGLFMADVFLRFLNGDW